MSISVPREISEPDASATVCTSCYCSIVASVTTAYSVHWRRTENKVQLVTAAFKLGLHLARTIFCIQPKSTNEILIGWTCLATLCCGLNNATSTVTKNKSLILRCSAVEFVRWTSVRFSSCIHSSKPVSTRGDTLQLHTSRLLLVYSFAEKLKYSRLLQPRPYWGMISLFLLTTDTESSTDPPATHRPQPPTDHQGDLPATHQ